MYIKSLEFKNFRRFKHLKMDLPFDKEGNPLPVVLIGINGAGKSSVLEGISLFLMRIIDNHFTKRNFYSSDIDLKLSINDFFINDKKDIAEKIEKDVELYIENETIHSNQSIIRNELSNTLRYGSLRTTRFLEEYITSNRPVVKHFPTSRGNLGLEKTESFKNKKPSDYPYSDSFNARLSDFDNFLTWYEERENYENQEKLKRKNFDFVDEDLDYVRTCFIQLFKHFPKVNFENLRIERVHKNGNNLAIEKRFVIDKNGQTFNLAQLSAGEKLLLMLIGDVARKIRLSKSKKGIVLIDEIDLHLHPSWQRVIVKALHQVFPSIQFIVTTHSPIVINHVPQASVFVLEEDTVISMAKRRFNSYGADIEDILKIVQGVEEAIPDEVQLKLDKYFSLIDDNKISEAKTLQKELEELIDTQHPELLKGQTLIEFKEMLAE